MVSSLPSAKSRINFVVSSLTSANSRIKILYSNVRSIVNKIEELKHTSFDLKPDIICLCETWTNNLVLDSFLNIENYIILCTKDRSDTQQGKGGGLFIYVKTGILALELKTEYFESYNQCCAITLKLQNNKKINVVLVYRPHSLYNSGCVSENNKTLCDILKLVPKPYIVVGDFNYSDVNWDTNTATSKSKEFLNAVNDLF